MASGSSGKSRSGGSRSASGQGKNPKSRSSAGRSGASRTGSSSAQVSRAGSGARKDSRKKTSTQKRKDPSVDSSMNMEVFCWVLLAVSVLCFISLFGIGGQLGSAAGDFLFGLMGVNAYLFPPMMFFLTIYMRVNRGVRRAAAQTWSAVGLFVVICGLEQLMLIGWRESHSLLDYYEVGAQYHSGGGLIGGGLTALFCPTIGVAGAYIVLIIAVFLFTALITQKSLFVDAGKKSSEALRRRHEENGVMRQQRAAARAQERERRRREQEEEDSWWDEEEGTEDRLSSAGAAGKRGSNDSADILAEGFFASSGRKSSQKKKEKRQRLSPGDVVFGKVQDGGSETSRDGVKVVSSGSAGLKTSLKKPSEASGEKKPEQAGADDREDAAEASAESSLFQNGFSQTEDIGLSPSFVIHRGSQESDPGAEQKDTEEEDSEETAGSAAPAADVRAGAGRVVTAEDIRNAGASQIRRAQRTGQKTAGSASGEAPSSSRPDSSSAVRQKVTADEAGEAMDQVSQEIEQKEEEEEIPYTYPPIDCLKKPPKDRGGMTDDQLRETALKLQKILSTFGVNAQVTNVSCGPSVTRYELLPEMGTKVSKIVNLADDIKLNLAAADIRIEAPIPGKAAVGIEVPNKEPSMVYLRELIDSEEFRKQKSRLAYVVGKDIAGKIVVADIAKMPHLLIAGATGSGKSVFINTMIMSIIYNADPSEVKMIMIDPKVVELSVYNGIPHLFIPVVTDPKKAAGALNWGVAEMTRRYQLFAEVGVRNLAGYNAKAETLEKEGVPDAPKKLPQIVIIVDELADLMMVSGNEVEDAICRLAQLARACGIHLVIATQRPSVDVITGLIKANIPSRIAFAVSSGTDSRTILDMNGAEKLLGNGDMLFSPQNYKKPVRIQGAFVSDEEIQEVVDAIRIDDESDQSKETMQKRMAEVQKAAASIASSSGGGDSDVDELFADAGKFIIQKDKASIGMLQRWFKIGFNRAARIMDQLADAGVVGEDEGTKPRKVLMSEEQFENYLEQN